jgi:hypothetical protein
MKTTNFINENTEAIATYFEKEIIGFWNISLEDFINDLTINFKQITTGEELKKFDLFGNLQSAKSRLGLMNTNVIAEDKKTNALRAKYQGTQFMSMV